MKQILIMSDTHGLTNEIMMIKKRHRDVDVMIHCGDSELTFNHKSLANIVSVRGNCDMDAQFPEEKTIEIAGRTIFITHGHLYNVKSNLMNLSYKGMEKDAHIVCFGHTHLAGAEKIEGRLFINPGSIRYPRLHPEPTYAILKLSKNEQATVNFYTLHGKTMDELSYETTL